MMNSKISVIIPAYNEEKAIGKVLDDVNAVMKEKGYNFEIIVVDDASTDRTAEIASSKNAKIIRYTTNEGVGAARKSGILKSSGEVIVMLDADGTYPAKSIPDLLSYIPEYDQVIGCRNKEQGSLKILRQTAKWIMFKLASFLVKQSIPDLNSGLRAMKKNILMKYLYLIPNGFSCVSTMTLVFLCNGYNVKYIPIEYYKRIGRSKFRIFVDTKGFLFTVLRIIMYFNPLRIFLSLGLLVFSVGAAKTAYDLFFPSQGYKIILDIVILVIAFIILLFGLLADLIVTQTKR